MAMSLLRNPLIGLAALYLGLSLATFIVYAVDKAAAKRSKRRVPEKSLHLLALAGGWPGALMAQHFLRHKSSKQPFRLFFWLTVILNVTTAVALFGHQSVTFL